MFRGAEWRVFFFRLGSRWPNGTEPNDTCTDTRKIFSLSRLSLSLSLSLSRSAAARSRRSNRRSNSIAVFTAPFLAMTFQIPSPIQTAMWPAVSLFFSPLEHRWTGINRNLPVNNPKSRWLSRYFIAFVEFQTFSTSKLNKAFTSRNKAKEKISSVIFY